MSAHTLHLACYSSISITQMCSIINACEREWPRCVIVSREHPLIAGTGAVWGVASETETEGE